MSVGGILGGTQVEVCAVDRLDGGDLLVALITDPPTWVYMRAGNAADELSTVWAGKGSRICIPMPPGDALMDACPAAISKERP